MRRLMLPGLMLSALFAVTSCSTGADGAFNNAPAGTAVVAAEASSGGNSGSEASEKSSIELEGSTSGRDFPCNLVDASLLAEVISEPAWDEEAVAMRQNKGTCTWGSGVDLGDEVTLVWSPNDYSKVRPAGTPVGGVGDEAFTLSNVVNDVEHDRQGLGQTSMYVGFDEQRFLLQVRSGQPVFVAQTRLAASIVEKCGADCGPPKAVPSPTPALEDSACALLTNDEVTSITGVVASGKISTSSNQGCQWDHQVNILQVDAVRWEEFQALENVMPVDGVGGGAFQQREQLILTQDGEYWLVMSTSGTTPDESVRQLSELGRLLASRV